MHYILYNPLSSHGKSEELVNKIEKILTKENATCHAYSLIKASKNIKGFAKKLKPEDKIVVIGGDGTLHHFANGIKDLENQNELFLYKGGTGNDFSREFPKQKLINISKYVRNLPIYKINGEDKEFVMVNGCGFGFDGAVCDSVNKNNGKKSGFAYIKSVLSLLKNYPRYELELEVDGVKHTYKKVLFTVVNNGKYFGGGMKISPTSDRLDNKLECYIIHSLPFRKVLFVFPFLFMGKHMLFKKWGVEKIVGTSFKVKASTPQPFQSDGEVELDIHSFEVKAR
jgi:diacylglycerol kinase family enzyme